MSDLVYHSPLNLWKYKWLDSHSYGAMWHLCCKHSEDVFYACRTSLKEQKGKRKYHAGTPHPNDRGGFTQWFGSCSLMSTLYVWFPASWAPMVAERLFSWSPPSRGSTYPQDGRPASGPPQTYSGAHPWHQNSQGAAGSSEAMEDTDSWSEVQDQTVVIARCYNCAGAQC